MTALTGDPKTIDTLGSCARKTKSYFRAQITLQNTDKQEQADKATETKCFLNLISSALNMLHFLSKFIPIPVQNES